MMKSAQTSALKTAKSTTPGKETASWQQDFLVMLPKIKEHAGFMFRNLNGDDKDEAVQEVICNACASFSRLAAQGRKEAATWSSLARFGVRQVRDGRMVGTPRNVKDVTSQHCQQRKNIVVQNTHCWDDTKEEWAEMVVEDRHATPADLATFRLDFRDWLKSLSRRNRKIALKLCRGESTRSVARLFHLSAGRISQLRNELYETWRRFQGEATVAEAVT